MFIKLYLLKLCLRRSYLNMKAIFTVMLVASNPFVSPENHEIPSQILQPPPPPLLVSNSPHRLLPRSRTCIHRLPRSRCSDAFGPSMVGSVFLYGLLAGTRQRGTRVNLQFIKLWTGYLVCFTSLCINIAENMKGHILMMTSNFCLISSLWALRDL